jgi:hypothetical protein
VEVGDELGFQGVPIGSSREVREGVAEALLNGGGFDAGDGEGAGA